MMQSKTSLTPGHISLNTVYPKQGSHVRCAMKPGFAQGAARAFKKVQYFEKFIQEARRMATNGRALWYSTTSKGHLSILLDREPEMLT